MKCLYFLVLCSAISGISSQDDDETEEYKCVVPPKDILKNGKFEVQGKYDNGPPAAGTKMYSYRIEVTCDPGFKLIGDYVVNCQTDKFLDDFPKCVPQCKRKSPELISCGAGADNEEAQCFSTQEATLSTRVRQQDLQCGVIPQVFRTTVSNGTVAKPEDAPWHAGIYTKTTRPYMQICGGTIVSTNVVISAAHCFWNNLLKRLPAEEFAVAVGKVYRPWDEPNDKTAQKFEVNEIRIPPRFQGSTTNFQDDIAVLILASEIRFGQLIVPACLDFDYDLDDTQLKSGRLGRVSGFGLTSADGAASQVLIYAELPVVDIEQCIATAEPGFVESITSDKICAGFANGTAVCRGDSGGGLLIPDNIEGATRYYLRGVVSTAPTNDFACNVYAVATFTQIVRHERFIRQALDAAPESQIPITTTQDPFEFVFGRPYKESNENLDNPEAPAANPLTNIDKNDKNNEEIETTTTETDFKNLVEDLNKTLKKRPGYVEPTKAPSCNDLPPAERFDCLATSTERDEIAYLDSIFKTTENPVQTTQKPLKKPSPNKPTCDHVPDDELADCLSKRTTTTSKYIPEDLGELSSNNSDEDDAEKPIETPKIDNIKDNKSTSINENTNSNTGSKDDENISSNTGTQVETETPVPITNPPTFNKDEHFGPDDIGDGFDSFPTGPMDGPNFGNMNNQGMKLPNQRDSNVEGINKSNKNKDGVNQGLLIPGNANLGGNNKGGVSQSGVNNSGVNQGVLDQGVITLGGLTQGGISQGGQNKGDFTQGAISLGGLTQRGQNKEGSTQSVLDQGVISLGGLTQGGISQGGQNKGDFTRGGISQGGLTQRGQNKEGSTQSVLGQGIITLGGLTQGGISQGGQNKGDFTQGGISQGGLIQGGLMQGGLTQGGLTQGGLTRGGLTQGGLTQGGLTQGVLNKGSLTEGGLNQGGLTQGGLTQGGQNQGILTQGGLNQGGIIQGGQNQVILTQGGLNQGGIIQGGLKQGILTQGGQNKGVFTQGGQNQFGNGGQLNQGTISGSTNQNLAGQLGLYVGALAPVPTESDKIQGVNQGLANQLGLNYGVIKPGLSQEGSLNQGFNQAGIKVGVTQGQSGIKFGGINQGGISQGGINLSGVSQGGINPNGINQGAINLGSISQGAINQAGINQGAINQGSSNQVGINEAGINQGGIIQGSINQGISNQVGISLGGINPSGINRGGINQVGLAQGFLVQPGLNGQGNINAGGINQAPQTVTNKGAQIQGSMNVGHTYLPPGPAKNTKITIKPLIPTVIPLNAQSNTKIDIKPIPTNSESAAQKTDVKTSVLEQYFVTTEPNYQDNYQGQFWQYNSPNYQHNQHYEHNNQGYHHDYQQNNPNWQWQNWQKQDDWQNWNSQWEHNHHDHHTNKHGGHWW